MRSGFTIIEVLVALLAASIIALMSFEYLSNVVNLEKKVKIKISKDRDELNAGNIIRLDLLQSIPFLFKDEAGRKVSTPFFGNQNNTLMSFVSLSTSDNAKDKSKLRRVNYYIENDNLVRQTSLPNNKAVVLSKRVLLKDIKNYQILFGEDLSLLDEKWPNNQISNSNDKQNKSYPKLIVFSYSIEQEERVLILSTYK